MIERGDTPLHVAIKIDFLEGMRIILEQNKNELDRVNLKGYTPLMLAAKHEQLEKARYLVKLGATTNAINDQKNTPSLTLAKRKVATFLKTTHGDIFEAPTHVSKLQPQQSSEPTPRGMAPQPPW